MRLLVFAGAALACTIAVAQESLIVVTSPSCGPCKQFKADAGESGLLDAISVTWLELPRDRRDARRLKVSAVPTFILMDGSDEVARKVGYDGPDGFLAWLNR